ncbi:BatA and WFA domain-containing protein [Luteolibacter flavescens]|uniref:BatA and WFA domain-containing protein n=1 Tax=Luteolibacter flavescens TaxID=1859460 RepID=A0ABT3FQ46_9BACT|nr:BatA and WFA domain-containing protein [Luteolibacter flavescens]MCW1885695.1 BatA and WFA domain-containing protein [Luteolibacter flavescens]
MSLFFQHPALFGLLALAGVPLLVHLLARAKPPQYRFSNIEFLKKVQRLTSRFRKPKDWLLLALRTLALVALAAAFLGPLLLSKNAALPGEKRSVVLLIDRSASMAAKEGAASRFEAACAAAGEILDASRPDLANIIWIDAAPDAVFPDLAPNRDFLTEELAKATARPEPGAIDAAIDLALRQLREAGGRRELHVISDFQASAWQHFAPVIPDGIDLRMVPVAKEDVPNLAVTSLVALPTSPVAGQQMVVQCRVANPSREARRISLTLDAGGSRQSQPLDLPPQGEAEAAFSVRCASSGLMPLTAEIDADGFPGDDRRHAVVRVRESLRLAIAAPEGDAASGTLEQVARAVPWLDAVPGVDLEKLPPSEFLYIPGWTGDAADRLREIAANGTAVIVHASPDCPASSVEALLGGAAAESGPLGLESSDQGWEASPAGDHAAFKLFAGGEFGNPLGGRFRQRLRIAPSESATTIASFSDGKPALIEAKDRPLLVSNLSLDPAASTWSREPAFLPAFAELLLHLMPRQTAEAFTVEPGGVISWTNPSADTAATPVLESPDGSRPEILANGATWQSPAPAVPGIHRWLVSDQPVHLIAVPFPESESLLRPLDTPPSAGPAVANSDIARRAALDQGLPLWPWLIAAALLLLLTEGVIAGLRPAPKPALN